MNVVNVKMMPLQDKEQWLVYMVTVELCDCRTVRYLQGVCHAMHGHVCDSFRFAVQRSRSDLLSIVRQQEELQAHQ